MNEHPENPNATKNECQELTLNQEYQKYHFNLSFHHYLSIPAGQNILVKTNEVCRKIPLRISSKSK